MPINILHIRDTFEIGGPGKTILETISHIDNEKFRIHIAVFMSRKDKNETPFIKEARKRGFSIHIIQSYNQYDPRILSRIIKLTKELKIDIIHTHESLSNILCCLISRLHHVRIITTLHGWINNTFKDKIKTAVDRTFLRYYDRVIVVSETMKKQIVDSGVSPDKIRVLYNSIVIDNYSKNNSVGYLSDVTGEKLNRPIVGTIGRLSAEKGHKDFIKAASIVLERGYKATFVIVGDGPEKNNILEMIESLNLQSKIFLTGYMRNIQNVFSDLELMVLPSYTEGLSNIVLESLLMDVPVIATRVGGTPEIIKDNETGALVNAGSPEQISNKVIEYLNNPDKYNIMTTVGKSLVKNKFNFIERTKKLEIIYNELINNKAGS